jgi:hypothetical protein
MQGAEVVGQDRDREEEWLGESYHCNSREVQPPSFDYRANETEDRRPKTLDRIQQTKDG